MDRFTRWKFEWKSAMHELLHSRRAILYLLLALMTVFIEGEEEILKDLHMGECDSFTLPVRMLYQRFVTLGHPMRAHRVVLVTYSVRDVPALAGPCNKRAFVGALIRRLAAPEISPSVIAVDHWYDPAYCKDGADEIARSKELEDTLVQVSPAIPIVLGADSDSLEDLHDDPDLAKLQRAGFARKDQLLKPSAFNAANVSFGLVRLDCDNRLIPLEWWVYPGKEEFLKGAVRIPKPSLAYETARHADPQLTDTLAPLIAEKQHPFTGFIPETKFSPLKNGKTLTAIGILCNSEITGATKQMLADVKCEPASTEELKLLRGSVLLMGEDNEGDWHMSVLGKVPGYVLHANYIDALVSDYYFRPLNGIIEIILTIAGIFLLVYMFEAAPTIVWGFIASSFALLVLVAICHLITIYSKWFLGFWLPLVLIPFVEALYYTRTGKKPFYRFGAEKL